MGLAKKKKEKWRMYEVFFLFGLSGKREYFNGLFHSRKRF